MAEGYRDLIVWQRAVQLSVSTYKLTAAFPREEIYGITSQMRRASVSIASNIAEGWGRQSDGEYKQFLGVARGSTYELLTQLEISAELGFGAETLRKQVYGLSNEVSKMLVALMRTV